jgi:hypothetical protein
MGAAPLDEHGLTGREALLAGGMAAGVALWSFGPGEVAWGTSRLNPVRAATYRRLIGALGRAPDRRFSHRDAEAAVRDFRRWYDGQDATVRAHADAVLDTLASESDLTYARLAGAATPEGSAVLAAALGLAAVACDPPPDEDERPTVPALGVPG